MSARHLLIGLLSGLPLVCHSAFADVNTVNVVQVGGQVNNLYVVFSQSVGTDLGCPSTRLIVNAASFSDSDSFKRFNAAMLLAMTTGTSVTIAVSGCYSDGDYPSMIATDYYFVNNS